MSNARLREALNAGGPGTGKDKGPPVADGVLSVTPDTPEAAEWRSRQSAIDFPSSSSTYLEEDDDGSLAAKPADLYGKFTWKIENFSDISKRELRSNVFEVGSYKWYILVYPQGCDVCNHLSLFLCVADYDKLLPGWSHFAQFTIAVVNKDPKKSKYSDTLHRFCKKEHDWGWKKFMELSKVLDGFTVADTLVIKAQVQVIKDRIARPFRCLDPQYRRELVRVYLTNVEGICRRFVEDRRERLSMFRENPGNFRSFWKELQKWQKGRLTQEKCDSILKAVVKRFFNEKEVTSTLVMDALYSGCRAMEEHTRQWLEYSTRMGPAEPDSAVEQPSVLIHAERGLFSLGDDVFDALERAANESILPFRDDKSSDSLCGRNQSDDDYGKDSVDRDERRLAELGRWTVEMFVLSHVYTESLEVAYREAESLKRQEALIKEEEEQERLEDERTQARQAAEKERKNRKKERKAKAKAKKDAEDAERRRQEEKARVEQEAKARAAAEKKRVAEESKATQDMERAAAASKLQQQRDSSASTATGSKKATASGDRKPASSQPPKKPPTDKPPESNVEKAAGKAPPTPASSHADESGDDSSEGSTVTSHSGEAPSPQRSSRNKAEQGKVASASWKQSESSAFEVKESEGTSLSTAEVAGPSSSHDSSDEVAQLKQQLRWMEVQLAERDAEIYALRVQLSELSTAKGELGIVTPSKGAQSLQRSSSGSQLDLDATAPRPPSRPPSRDGNRGGSGDGASGRSGRENGGGAAFGSGPQRMVPPASASSAQQTPPSPGGAADPSMSQQQPAEGRGSGRAAKRAGELGVGGKYAVQAATAAAAAALNARQVPGGATVAPASMPMTQSQAGARPEGLRAQQSQTASASSHVPAQQSLPTARQQANGPLGVPMQPHAGKHMGASPHSIKQPPSSLYPPAASSAHGSSVGQHGNGMMAIPTSNGPVTSQGGAHTVNGVPSYRNAAMGQVAEGQQAGVGVTPPPPPPMPISPSSAIPGKDSLRQSDNGDPQYQRLMMHQQQQQRQTSASLAAPFATPVPKGPNMPGTNAAESPGLDDFAHMGLITDLLD